ncbi:hypothetical protein BANRA_04086 [Acinetobacter baumannii]|nr:hypothetical protein BANRA_04086 [Acinetobacter baumannii]
MEVQRGILPLAEQLHVLLKPRVGPKPCAICSLVTFDAKAAFDMNLITEICPEGTELKRAIELAEHIAQAAPLAVKRPSPLLVRQSMKVTKWLLTNCKTIFSLYSQQKMFKKCFRHAAKRPPVLKVNKSYSSTALYSLKLMDIVKSPHDVGFLL